MSPPEEGFVPDDPGLYGPDPSTERRNRRPLRDILGVTPLQFALIVGGATLLFVFLGGPIWSAARTSFPLRLFASYLIIPLLVLPFLWWNGRSSLERLIAASLAAAGAKFALTVILDVLQGMTRRWPP
jgi:hypothetical protein